MTWFGTLVDGQPADGVHDAAVRRHAVLHEGHRRRPASPCTMSIAAMYPFVELQVIGLFLCI